MYILLVNGKYSSLLPEEASRTAAWWRVVFSLWSTNELVLFTYSENSLLVFYIHFYAAIIMKIYKFF